MKKPEFGAHSFSSPPSLLSSVAHNSQSGSDDPSITNLYLVDSHPTTIERSDQIAAATPGKYTDQGTEPLSPNDKLLAVLQLGEQHALEALKSGLVEARPRHIAICMRIRFFDFIREVYMPRRYDPEAVKELLSIACKYAKDDDLIEILHWDFAYRNPIKLLISSGRTQLLHHLIESRQLFANSSEFRSLLRNRQILAAKQSINSCNRACPYKTNSLLKKCKNISVLIQLINDPELILDAVVLLQTVKISHVTAVHLVSLKEMLKNILEPEAETVLARHWNPILVCIVLAELADSYIRCSKVQAWEFDDLSTGFCALATTIMNSIKDFVQMEMILLDDSYRQIPLFDLLTRNSKKYRMLLQHPYLAIIIDRLWSGGSDLKFGIQHCSYVFNKLTRSSPEKVWQIKPLSPKVHSIFQFKSWKYNATIRQVSEGLLLFCLFLHALYITSIYTRSTLVSEFPLNSTDSERGSAQTDLDTVRNAVDLYLIFLLLLAVNLSCKFLYKFLLKESIYPDPRVITDLVLTSCALCFKLEVFGSLVSYTSNYEYLWAVLFSVILIRAGLCLTITRQFGPILKMIQIIIVDVSKYLFVYFISICIFAVAANLLFFRTGERYETFSRCMITMFEASLGSFDFSEFTFRKYTGWAFLTIWIFFSAVILLNLLIAVLSSRYNEISPQANADYASLMYTYYSSSRFTPVYGALVLFPAPWNCILVPFIPLFFFKRTAYKASYYLVHVSYLLQLAVTVLIFTLLNLALIPVVYCKILHWLSSGPRFPRKSVTVTAWVFLGPAYLLMLGGSSFKVLFKFLYNEEKAERVNMEPLKQQIENKLEELCKEGVTSLPVSELKRVFCIESSDELLLLRKLTPFSQECFSDTMKKLSRNYKLSLLLKFQSSPEVLDVNLALKCIRNWSWKQLQMADPWVVKEALSKPLHE